MRRVSKGRRNWESEDVQHREREKEGKGEREATADNDDAKDSRCC